jgi:hypothetical protein
MPIIALNSAAFTHRYSCGRSTLDNRDKVNLYATLLYATNLDLMVRTSWQAPLELIEIFALANVLRRRVQKIADPYTAG